MLNRPLARVEDLGRDLVRSLRGDVRRRAVLLDRAPADLVAANRTVVADGDGTIPLVGIWRDAQFPDPAEQAKLQALSDKFDATAGLSDADHEAVAYTVVPKGVAAAEFDGDQRAVLSALLDTYFGRAPAAVSPADRYLDDAVLDQVFFAWAGPTDEGQPHYYRVQGPNLLIEWDNTPRSANHAHSVWRDPSTDFGMDVLAGHRAAHRH
jgi:hypothetical protein